ncbi:type II secretion system minor pseudopilin GspH [Kordiimonas marina]|uniref:type II secretion system minor pseudopilin GspH n=1 Tax=Kordiimonas marina TaxID=2872312 RepID=UPI001FF693D6|nr:type II secretion system minor pseudopilin GspH [Kordiimonas marina]MCJ9430049.1 type II secretion system minor pseudopilin GspH [Kordiimonas marina]
MSLTGKNSQKRTSWRVDEGFTLIEVMVVIVIVGLMTGMVMFTLMPHRASLEDDATRLVGRLAAARRSAVLEGQSVGLQVSDSGYRFLRYRRGRWQPYSLVPDRTSLTWPEDTDVSLAVGGVYLRLERDRHDHRARPRPALVFSAIGEAVPFDLTLARDQALLHIRGDGAGHMVIGR